MPSSISRVFQRIHDVVRRIPRGRVMTYGQVAAAAGIPRGARVVGYAMRAAKGAIPWQRVVGLRRKGIAHITIKDPIGAARQRQLLQKEGVKLRKDGGIELERYGPATRA
jgi:methylated-DNA-protein-cysteine methyltransferase-like protein